MLGVPPLVYNTKFEQAFAMALKELNIPESECKRAHNAISKICRGTFHPKTIRDGLIGQR